MRINPILNNGYLTDSNFNKCRKPCGIFSNSLNQNDVFEKSDKNSLKQDLSFGWVRLLSRGKVKSLVDKYDYLSLSDSGYLDIEYKKDLSHGRPTCLAHFHPECLLEDSESKKAIEKIKADFIKKHPKSFKMSDFKRGYFLCYGGKELSAVAKFAKDIKPYEMEPEKEEDWVHDHGYVE